MTTITLELVNVSTPDGDATEVVFNFAGRVWSYAFDTARTRADIVSVVSTDLVEQGHAAQVV